MAPVAGKAFLNRVIARVYAAGQNAASREEHDLYSLNLRLLSELLQGNPQPWPAACFSAFGSTFEKWRERTLERKSKMAWELNAAVTIPDYDPAEAAHARMVKATEMGRKAESGRAVFPLPEQAEPAQQKPVRGLLGNTAEKNAG